MNGDATLARMVEDFHNFDTTNYLEFPDKEDPYTVQKELVFGIYQASNGFDYQARGHLKEILVEDEGESKAYVSLPVHVQDPDNLQVGATALGWYRDVNTRWIYEGVGRVRLIERNALKQVVACWIEPVQGQLGHGTIPYPHNKLGKCSDRWAWKWRHPRNRQKKLPAVSELADGLWRGPDQGVYAGVGRVVSVSQDGRRMVVVEPA
ncbi:hypothetical protein BJX64DRAFT_107031 [Aspergillus heterothallicus]